MARRRLAIAPLAAAVTLATLAACGGGADDGLSAAGGGDGSVRAMLGLVAAGSGTGDFVVYGNLARLREATGIAAPEGEPEDYVGELMDAATTGWTVADPFRTSALMIESAETGFDLTDIDVSLQAGSPPDQVSVFTGRIDDGAVDQALTTFEPFADSVESGEREGVATYRFGEDGEMNIEARTPARPLGENVRVGVRDGTVWWTRSDAVLDRAIDAAAGERPSLGEDEGFGAVADTLDEAGAHTAVLLGDPTVFGLSDPSVILGGRDVSPEQIEAIEEEFEATALGQWQVAALGERLRDGNYEMVIALWHGDEDAAATSAERLETMLREGSSFRTARAWSEICSDPAVERDGALVTATCSLDVPGTSLSIATSGDSLLIWR